MQWIGALSGIVFLAWLARYSRRRPLLAFAFFFILFQFGLRAVASVFLDAAGPVFAVEVLYDVGGTGATLAWVIASAGTVLVVGAFLRPSSVARGLAPPAVAPAGPRDVTLGDVVFWLSAFFVAVLFADMFARGVIPLFDGLERWEYTEQYAGPFHKWLFEFGSLASLMLGALCVYPRLRGGETDLRFVGVLLAIFAYAFLAGHRFSAFYAFASFFLLPRAALYVHEGVVRGESRGGRLLRHLLASRLAIVAVVVLVLATLAMAIVNSLINVRGIEPALAVFSFVQRTLVQPQQMWFLTYERVFLQSDYEPLRAVEFLFFDPIVPGRNSSVQYLMTLAVGERYTAQILEEGAQFAGGYPEVLFEIFGPWVGWLPVLLFAVVTGALLRALLRAVCEGRFISVFAVLYVVYAFLLTYVGGMLNNFVNPVFWLKVLFMFAVLAIERRRDGLAAPLLPWVLWAPRRARAAESRP